MKKAELEAPGIGAVDAVLGRYLESQRSAVRLQLGSGEVAPAALKPAQHNDFYAEHRLRCHARRTRRAAKIQPVSALRQVKIGAVQNATARLAAAHPHGAVG